MAEQRNANNIRNNEEILFLIKFMYKAGKHTADTAHTLLLQAVNMAEAYIKGLMLAGQEIKEVSGQFEADLGTVQLVALLEG